MTAASLVGSAMALWLLVDAQRRVAGNRSRRIQCDQRFSLWHPAESMGAGGKPATGSAVYFSIVNQTGHNKFITECLCCGNTWNYKVAGTKQVAHLLGISGQSVYPCKFTIKQLPV